MPNWRYTIAQDITAPQTGAADPQPQVVQMVQRSGLAFDQSLYDRCSAENPQADARRLYGCMVGYMRAQGTGRGSQKIDPKWLPVIQDIKSVTRPLEDLNRVVDQGFNDVTAK